MTRLSAIFLALASISTTITINASLAQGAAIAQRQAPKQAPEAVYYMNNDDAANSVVAIRIEKDGVLTEITTTLTGGKGSVINDSSFHNFNFALLSAGSLRVKGRNLFAVNAGSNTLSMFAIDEQDPLNLTLLGSPVNTGGEFPVTVGVSEKHKMACVGNTGAVSGVACASYDPVQGLSPFDQIRNLHLNKTTPPTNHDHTMSETFFSADEDVLWSTVKGASEYANATGFLSAFRVTDGKVGRIEQRTTPPGMVLPFGTAQVPNSPDLIIADLSFGGMVVSVDEKNLTAKTESITRLPLNNATCWSTYSNKTGTGFLTDGALNYLVEVDVQSGAVVSITNGSVPHLGLYDTLSYGDFVYVLATNTPSGTNATVVSYDVSGGRGKVFEAQNFMSLGIHMGAQGLGVYPPT